MNYSCVELNDLPDEILLIIFKELDNLELLYSFQGVNERLNKIIHDTIFTSRLSFLKWSLNECINKFPPHIILNRFCSQILPKIHMKIKWLDIESESMKDILYAADYPNLYALGLYNIEEETASCLFTDERLISSIFKNQITKLIISIDSNKKKLYTMKNICNYIFTVFINLTHLIFYDVSYINNARLLFDIPSSSFSSSSLLVLNIKVQTFDICLYLLDGRFDQLHTLNIELANIFRPSREIENQRKIPNLKCFVLSCIMRTGYYDELILPLIYRMSNLEELDLDLTICVKETFIDGHNLTKNILNHMSQLKQFTFDIRSRKCIYNEMNSPSKEDIQRTFDDFLYTKTISCVDYFLNNKEGLCHIYSYPFLMKHYEDVTNNFPGGLYRYVCKVSLYDEYPFEHEFFIRIAQSFPFMKKLSIDNSYAQNYKQSYKLMNDNQNLSIVKYNYLIELRIYHLAHDDYIEEFLCNTKTYFQNNILLDVDYKALQKVTHHYTRDDTRSNCTKVNELSLFGKFEYSKSLKDKYLKDYFPFATIID
ncbi:unnamed protein product [Rotaria sordida]|uniref:F-box domain-containing protein n=2 Tax=Rotaria sordida TaxID=392033 RepID=A0A819STM0_9BILA|nr:unnamed protein product [Rotaria sordida]